MRCVIATSSAEHLLVSFEKGGSSVARLGVNKDTRRVFPDGEVYVRMDRNLLLGSDVKEVFVLHCGQPNPNAGLMELEMVLACIKNIGLPSEKVKLVLSYFPYGMQDEAFEDGEINVAEGLVRKWIEYYGVSEIVVLDPHFWGKDWVNQYAFKRVSGMEVLMDAVVDDWGDEVVFIGPDHGMERRSGLKSVQKVRKNSFLNEYRETEYLSELLDGKVVCVLDDILETGGTLCQFGDECLKRGAKKVVAAVTHGVLPEGVVRVCKKFEMVYITDSIDHKKKWAKNVTVVGVGSALAVG